MINKTWYKKIGSICFQFIAWFPILLILIQLIRNGNYNINWSDYTNPLYDTFHNVLINNFNISNGSILDNIISYGFGWNIFIELIDIIYLALLYFISCIKSFCIRD